MTFGWNRAHSRTCDVLGRHLHDLPSGTDLAVRDAHRPAPRRLFVLLVRRLSGLAGSWCSCDAGSNTGVVPIGMLIEPVGCRRR
jgi:hypothetical protein